MSPSRLAMILAGAAALVLTGLLVAHPDDPKGLIRRIAYVGPAYRSSGNAFDPALRGPGMEFPARGIQLKAWLPLGEFNEPSSANDCWGYVSPAGREYAIIGLQHGTGFVEITDSGNPQIVATISGSTSVWRDIKVYEQFVYVVTEGFNGGIQVFDLSQIDAGSIMLVNEVFDDIADPILATASSHNVAIDEASGFLYRCGGGNNGLRIYSLADPANPAFVGAWSERYVHDAQIVTYDSGPYAGRQIAFCCSGFNGGSVQTGLDVLDVTDKDNVINLARLLYTDGRYSHQAWLSPDRSYLYLNDEADETGLGFPTTTIVFDVTDPANPLEASTFTNGSAAIGHNLYTKGDFIFEANYRSGIRVFDAINPLAPVEVAFFDTYPENDAPQFDGMWSVYPYFPSGTFIGSDIEKGLFVFVMEDCDNDGVIDTEQIDADPSLDCNVNGVLDFCDILDQTSDDADLDGVPDECFDCNGNGQFDLIDLATFASDDCNGNEIPDECEADCNENGVPDDCDLNLLSRTTGDVGPVGGGVLFELAIPAAPVALGPVKFTVEARGDLGGIGRTIDVRMNGFSIGEVFLDPQAACPETPLRESFIFDSSFYNFFLGLNSSGEANFVIAPGDEVDGSACAESFLSLTVDYPADIGADCNGNGILDECEDDCNRNGVPDDCEVTTSVSVSTGVQAPVDAMVSYDLTIPQALKAIAPVQFIVEARGDLGGESRALTIFMNGFPIGSTFLDPSRSCANTAIQETVIFDHSFYNFFLGLDLEGDANFSIVAGENVSGFDCPSSFVSLTVQYLGDTGVDANGNGVPDECDPPVCQGLEATVYVDIDGIVRGGLFDGILYFGILLGTHGDDVIVGTDGPDLIIGLNGDDVICAGGGDDLVNGNLGDDTIDGGDGVDIVHGNGGTDTCINGEKVAGCENGTFRRILNRAIPTRSGRAIGTQTGSRR